MNTRIKLNKGDVIHVKAFPNQILERRVVSIENEKTVAVCCDEEFYAASRDGREPTAIGFPISDVIIEGHERSA